MDCVCLKLVAFTLCAADGLVVGLSTLFDSAWLSMRCGIGWDFIAPLGPLLAQARTAAQKELARVEPISAKNVNNSGVHAKQGGPERRLLRRCQAPLNPRGLHIQRFQRR